MLYALDAITKRTYLAICFSLSPYYLPWKNEIYEAILFHFADCCSLFFQEKRSYICRKYTAKTLFLSVTCLGHLWYNLCVAIHVAVRGAKKTLHLVSFVVEVKNIPNKSSFCLTSLFK